LLFGAPYVPTMKEQQVQALKLLDLKPGQTVLELGSGDGRFLLAAAKQGIKGIGYELNPIMYLISLVVTFKYRRLIKVYLTSFWLAKLPITDGIYIFLLAKFMAKLNKKIIQSGCNNVKVVSYAAKIPGQKIVKTVGPMYLYKY
jgi:SAM-dependent methyltransferase